MSLDTDTEPAAILARRLAIAQNTATRIQTPDAELMPGDAHAAFEVQHRVLALLGQPVAGWKVGAKSLDGPIQGAPLPADRVLPSGATLRRANFPVLALELEIAFRFGRIFEPFSGPHTDEEVVAAVSEMLAAIEIVSSRYTEWPAVDKLAQLADLQNHGALVCGAAVPYDAAYPFVSPTMSFTFDGVDVIRSRVANPCGDPRRLLGWLVNHAVKRGIAVGGDVVVTAGTYTGVHFPTSAGAAVGTIAGLPPVTLTLR
jgi:2-keto-4-pentenoate hydratase